MSEYIIKGETLTSIADAIRSKDGTTEPIPAGSMADRITALQVSKGNPLFDLLNHTITEVELPGLTRIYQYAFQSCDQLTRASFPDLDQTDAYAFANCKSLTHFYAPNFRFPGNYCFRGCTSLRVFEIYEPMVQIYSNVFAGCTALVALVIRKTSQLLSNSQTSNLTGTPIEKGTGYVYVPAALIEQYKTAYTWKTYAAQFRVLEDYTVDGTVTGELDERKI